MFIDRKDAGIQLAAKLKRYSGKKDTLVLALPRGGVVTGAEIARLLMLPLDVLIVRKIGHPLQPELAIGAVSETGTVELNQSIITASGVPKAYIDDEVSVQKREISRRVELYRGGKETHIPLIASRGPPGKNAKSARLRVRARGAPSPSPNSGMSLFSG